MTHMFISKGLVRYICTHKFSAAGKKAKKALNEPIQILKTNFKKARYRTVCRAGYVQEGGTKNLYFCMFLDQKSLEIRNYPWLVWLSGLSIGL